MTTRIPPSTIFPSDLPLATDQLTLPRFLEDCARRYGAQEALVFESERLRYRQLRERVRALARALLRAGVTKGTRVALLFGNRPELVTGIFAVTSIGAIAVPISTLALADERHYILRHSDAALLLLQPRLRSKDLLGELLDGFPRIAAAEPGRIQDSGLPFLRRVVCTQPDERLPGSWSWFVDGGAEIPPALLDAVAAEVTPDDDAMVIYTSGSTSQPKAVLHRQRAPVFQAYRVATVHAYPEGPVRAWSSYPLFWTGGLIEGLMAPMSAGATVVLQETFEVERALELLASERVTHVRTMIHDEVRLATHPKASTADLGAIRSGIVSEQLRARAGFEGEVAEICAYGATETFTIVSGLPFDAPIEERRSCHGVVIPGQEIRIVDVDTGAALPVGEPGEIRVKGPSLMRGYYKHAGPDPLDEAGYFRTGDVGRLDERGRLFYEGRAGDMIKTSGANVSPVEIQESLDDWGKLTRAVPIGVPHPSRGQAIVLCAVRQAGVEVDEEDVRAVLADRLSPFKRPHAILFFEADELTYTSSQKIKVADLRKLAIARLLDSDIEDDWRQHLERA